MQKDPGPASQAGIAAAKPNKFCVSRCLPKITAVPAPSLRSSPWGIGIAKICSTQTIRNVGNGVCCATEQPGLLRSWS